MNHVNFLPESYQKKLAHQRQKKRRMVLGVVLSLCLVAWWFVQTAQTAKLQSVAADLERQLDAARHQRSELVKLREEHTILRHQHAIRSELAMPVRCTQVIAGLSDVLPESVGVFELTLNTVRPAPEPLLKDDDKSKRKKVKPPTPEQLRDVIAFEFEAIAPDDLAIAEVVAAMQQHPLYQNVKMHYSREVNRYGVLGREFRLSAEVPLDAEYRSARSGEGIVDAR